MMALPFAGAAYLKLLLACWKVLGLGVMQSQVLVPRYLPGSSLHRRTISSGPPSPERVASHVWGELLLPCQHQHKSSLSDRRS